MNDSRWSSRRPGVFLSLRFPLLLLLAVMVGSFLPGRFGEGLAPCLEAWPGPAPTQPPVPVRVVAVADVEELSYGRYAIREYLDVYNDDCVRFLEVRNVIADTWVGHRRDRQGEEWRDRPFPVLIPPNSVIRVAERQRRIAGAPRRNWWVRWLRFTVQTDRGEFISNFADSPLKPPSQVVEELRQPEIDSLGAPGLRSPSTPAGNGPAGRR